MMTIKQIERMVIERRLARLMFNKTAAAISLGISLTTLKNKLRKYKREDEYNKSKAN